jgi:hypothetical protein
VTYVNVREVGAFAEVFVDRGEVGPADGGRRLSTARSLEPLKIISLCDPGMLSSLRVDNSISTVRTYRRTMEWSERLRAWYRDADGIAYLGRKAAVHTNYCLFLDRCSSKLEFEEIGQLGNLRSRVVVACDALHLAPRLFDPASPRGWPGRRTAKRRV